MSEFTPEGVRIHPRKSQKINQVFFKTPDIPTLIIDPHFLQDIDPKGCIRQLDLKLKGGGGGSKANFFGGSDLSFGHHRYVPLIIEENFGSVLGSRRPTVSELRPAQKLGVK